MDDESLKVKELMNDLSHGIHGQVAMLRMKAKILSKIVPDLIENYYFFKELNAVQKEVPGRLLSNIDDLLALDEQCCEILKIIDDAHVLVNGKDT